MSDIRDAEIVCEVVGCAGGLVYRQGLLAKIRPLLDLAAACPVGEGERLGRGTAVRSPTVTNPQSFP